MKKEEEVRKLMKFLQIDVDETRLRCLLDNEVTNYKRMNKKPNFVVYTKAQHQLIDDIIDKADEYLQARKGVKLPLQFYDLYKTYDDSCKTFSRGEEESFLF